MNILIEIPARGGSKGVPDKALQDLGGLPLIAYTISDALRVKGRTRVIVNTDSPDIRETAIRFGAEVPFLRPAELSEDHSDLLDAVVYSRNWLKEHSGFIPDIYIIMSPTNPFRRPTIVNDSLTKGLQDESIFNIGSVAPAKISKNNFWITDGTAVSPFNSSRKNDLPEDLFLCQSSMSFNIVFECRADKLPNRLTPALLTDIEAIDIDEKRDLSNARTIIAENLYPLRAETQNQFCSAGSDGIELFGKYFDEPRFSKSHRILIHPDYPVLNRRLIDEFTTFAFQHNRTTITGCKAKIHPYRMRYINPNGYSDFLYRIDQSVRGDRHLYPDVYSFVPAMVSIPPGHDCLDIRPESLLMYKVEKHCLLDQTDIVDRLSIQERSDEFISCNSI